MSTLVIPPNMPTRKGEEEGTANQRLVSTLTMSLHKQTLPRITLIFISPYISQLFPHNYLPFVVQTSFPLLKGI